MREGLTYSDVLIVPKYSNILSRDEIDVTVRYLGEKRLPIISAPMDYVTGHKMAQAMIDNGAYGIVSRFKTKEDEGFWIQDPPYGIAVGAKNQIDVMLQIHREKPHSVCIDVAHGHHANVINLIRVIKGYNPKIFVIAGNVATAEGFWDLQEAGADAIRVGIGPGSACSTRENTGIGVPQLSAILDCALVKKYHVALIADGGIQYPGDIAKALTAGADAVMLGKMLAGHDESPGIPEYDNLDRMINKSYRGQSLLGTNGERKAPEGVAGTVPYRGPVKDTIESLTQYLKSSFSYVGARNIEEFRERASFIRISPATLEENKTRI